MNEQVLTEKTGMGATACESGVAFRVWAPHAERVFVTGSFNNWTESYPMQPGDKGTWYAEVPEAKIGDEYRYLLCQGEQKLSRIDPYAREVTNSVGNGIVHDPHFDWGDDQYQLPPWPELVLYEMHIGTFNGPLGGGHGTYATAVKKFDHLQRLGKSRVPSEISAADPENFFAQKRSTLAAGLVFTAPGIPMLFQGQEFLQGGWFQDTVPLDWHLSDEFRGILRLYRDLVQLRLNRAGHTRGLCGRGINVHHVNEETNLLAFHRWDKGGPGDDVVVVANFENQPRDNYAVGFPRPGRWRLRLNSDWRGYSDDFSDFASRDVTAAGPDYDGCPARGSVEIGPYSLLILSQDP